MPNSPATGGRRKPKSPTTQRGSDVPTNTSLQLWKHVGPLATSSALLLYLSSVGTDRLSLTQTAFFLTAATADAAGRPLTRTELIDKHFGEGRASIRNSYRQLLEPSRVYPTALGWLKTEENPDDAREQLLRITEKGRRVLNGVLLSLEPILNPDMNGGVPN